MRWYTCTPVAFGGGADFFARDSGLLCRGLQANGVDCKAVMPFPDGPHDQEDLIRVEPGALRSEEWWRSQKLDGVVLYAWGSPRYLPVAEAIRKAGIFLVLNQDNGGLVSPVIDRSAWCREQLVLTGAGRVAGGWIRAAYRVVKGLTIGRFYQDRRRARHLSQGDVIACVSPEAARLHRTYCRKRSGEALAKKVALLPHAVDPRYQPTKGIRKDMRMTVAGRWEDVVQKRPELLISGVGRLLELEPELKVHIAGRTTPLLESWHAGLAESSRERVDLVGWIEPDALLELLNHSQVSWCPSAYESFHIASGEALCCGASVVAARSPSLSSFGWFVGDGDGRLAEADDVEGHVAAIRAELGAWRDGQRDPSQISDRWRARLHAPKVAARVLKMKEAGGPHEHDV